MTEHLVRQQVIEALSAYGVTSREPNWEARLIEGGEYVGRRFEFDGIRAYWLRNRRAIEFYNHDWELLGEREFQPHATVA